MENVEIHMQDEREEFKKTASACGIAVLLYFLLELVFQLAVLVAVGIGVCLKLLFNDFYISGEELTEYLSNENFLFAVTLGCTLVAFVITFLIIYRKRFFGAIKGDLCFERKNVGNVLRGIPVVFSAGISGGFIFSFFLVVTEQFGISYDADSVLEPQYTGGIYILYIIYVCVIAPVLEELIFRGFILGNLKKYDKKTAVIASAVMFSIFHAVYTQMPTAFLAGLALGGLYIYSGSVLVPILVHVGYNTIIQAEQMLEGVFPFDEIFMLLYSALFVTGMVLFFKKRKKVKFERNEGNFCKIFFTRISVLAVIIINLALGSMYIVR